MHADLNSWAISIALLSASPLLSMPASAAAEDMDPRYAAIDALGELNGVALQCKYIDQMRRMKAAVVRYAPKERSFGLAFDQASNRTFLRFIEQQQACPHVENFTRRVGHHIDALRNAFRVD